MKKVCALWIIFTLMMHIMVVPEVMAEESQNPALNITSVSAILMEPTSGKIIYEKNAHERLRPASVTKIMTLLLIFDALDSGAIKLEDQVTVSEHAASMGGSQAYLEPNEIQTVEDMIKCIAVASANDASVAMAEFIAGTEDAFVQKMNERAKGLGMENTTFKNSNGLDEDGHLTTAYDIALMSKELITKYPQIFDYTTIWQDSIIHRTKRGEEEFGLTSTNKLLKWYNGATGLKTGSTSKAKYCLSGTAERDGMQLIAVVMAAPDYKTRFQEVMTLFDYGFANTSLYQDEIKDHLIETLPVKRGVQDQLDTIAKEDFNYILTKEEATKEVEKEIILPEELKAPIAQGDKVGEILYKIGDKEIGKVDIVAKESVDVSTFQFEFFKVLRMLFK